MTAREGYNHIGDITWDEREGGRILLPLECYYPGTQPDANTCHTGSIGVADPRTLRWRYSVKLSPGEIPKAMWAEVSPDGRLLWTSAGDDLLAYRVADIRPGARTLRAVRRLRGAVPPTGITGAAFYGERLMLAGQRDIDFEVWSVDLATGQPAAGDPPRRDRRERGPATSARASTGSCTGSSRRSTRSAARRPTGRTRTRCCTSCRAGPGPGCASPSRRSPPAGAPRCAAPRAPAVTRSPAPSCASAKRGRARTREASPD